MRILSHMINDCRMPDRQVGLRVGLSGGAVRSRIERMEREGVIRGYVLKVEPPALGRGVFYIAVSGRDEEAITEQVRLVGDPFLVAPCVGGITVCGIAVDGDVRAKIRLARELMRDVRLLTIFEAETAEQRSRLTRTDLAIMREMASDPRMSAEAAAAATGFSSRTVARSVDRLRQDNSVQFTAVYDPKKVEPYIPHVILVGVGGGLEKVASDLEDSLGERFLQNPILTPNQIVLFLYSTDIYTLDELTQTVRDADGVETADLFIPKSIRFEQDWAGPAIRDAIGSATLRIAR